MNHGYDDDGAFTPIHPYRAADQVEDYEYLPPPRQQGPSGLLAQLMGGGFTGFHRPPPPR